MKQAPESKRESFLIKELEDILRKEGLSTNPSEKGNRANIINKFRDLQSSVKFWDMYLSLFLI